MITVPKPKATPSQINTVLRRAAPHSATGEAKLILAVIGQAVYDVMCSGCTSSERINKQQARSFFTSRRHQLFCESVGLDPDWVSEILRDHAGIGQQQERA